MENRKGTKGAPAGEREAEAAAIAEEIDWLIRQWDAGVSWSGERMAELLEAAGKAAEMLTAQQRTQAAGVPDGVEWIACSERLPEHGGPVAVWCSGSESPGVAWMRQGAWYMPEPQAIGYDTITHWAPFPPAPAQPAVHDQSEKVAHSAQWPTTPGLSAGPSEVQRLREALAHCSEVMKDPWKHGEGCISRAINRADAALAASTAQQGEGD